MIQSLPGVERHKLVKGRRSKDGGRALHGVGEKVKAVNNKRPLGGTVGRAGQLYGEIALVVISLKTVRQARA
jgi:hypothetical protein